ncbi:MAG TPA: HAMP domain-containing sensor histidine kinase [Gemmatimonadaceae bacterium]|nr:HAMP domain-containing sensor histidine kinase [Gemmatimonadaceae bacterium]
MRLQEGLAEAVDRSSRILAESPAKLGEMRAALEAILLALPALGAVSGEEIENSRLYVPRQHIDVLRAEMLSAFASAGPEADARELVVLLSALEDLRRRSERTVTGRFVARLAGAESVNAVVEIAHDIRSPLSSILFLVDTIRRGQSGVVSAVQERQLGLVYSAALGLSTLSNDLIDAVRGERLVDGSPVPFSVTETILNVCAIVQPISEEKNLPLNATFPEFDGRVGYPSALNRVLLNLTTNALRYTDVGSVSVGCTEHSDQILEFWIRDTGRGIPDKVLAMLFDGFRPGSVGMRFSSAGLGLAISRTLIEAMGSSLTVDTAVDEGTQFSFVLDLPRA